MLARSRLATAPVSSSASITTRPSVRCRPPANLSSVETSAFRQHGLTTGTRLSSSFTTPVIAIRVIPLTVLTWGRTPGTPRLPAGGPAPPPPPPGPPQGGAVKNLRVRLGQQPGVVTRGAVRRGHVGHHQPGAEDGGRLDRKSVV